MATRHLRKVQEQLAAQQQRSAAAPDAAEEEESSEPPSPPGRAPFNPFDLLSDEVVRGGPRGPRGSAKTHWGPAHR